MSILTVKVRDSESIRIFEPVDDVARIHELIGVLLLQNDHAVERRADQRVGKVLFRDFEVRLLLPDFGPGVIRLRFGLRDAGFGLLQVQRGAFIGVVRHGIRLPELVGTVEVDLRLVGDGPGQLTVDHGDFQLRFGDGELVFLPLDIVFELDPVDLEKDVPFPDPLAFIRLHEVERAADAARHLGLRLRFDVALHPDLLDEFHLHRLHDDDLHDPFGRLFFPRAPAPGQQRGGAQGGRQLQSTHFLPPDRHFPAGKRPVLSIP